MTTTTRAELLTKRNGLADRLAELRDADGWVRDADADLVAVIRREKAALDTRLDAIDGVGDLPSIAGLFQA